MVLVFGPVFADLIKQLSYSELRDTLVVCQKFYNEYVYEHRMHLQDVEVQYHLEMLKDNMVQVQMRLESVPVCDLCSAHATVFYGDAKYCNHHTLQFVFQVG